MRTATLLRLNRTVQRRQTPKTKTNTLLVYPKIASPKNNTHAAHGTRAEGAIARLTCVNMHVQPVTETENRGDQIIILPRMPELFNDCTDKLQYPAQDCFSSVSHVTVSAFQRQILISVTGISPYSKEDAVIRNRHT